MPHHCMEAAHFFICVYVVLLGLTSLYLSVGFPCNPWADLMWDKQSGAGGGGVTELGHSGPSTGTKSRACWRGCEAYALRLHIVRNPEILQGNPRVYLVNSLLSPTQPNPFCYSSPYLLPEMSENPFCSTGHPLTPYHHRNNTPLTEKEFKEKKMESGRVHSYVMVSLCLDCIVVSLSILLIYISTLPQSRPYFVTFLVTFFSHLLSLFLSSHVTKWLSCVQRETNARFCDASEDIKTSYAQLRIHLPEKSSGVSNFEISLVIKNVNMVCLMLGGVCYFSLRRSFEGGILQERFGGAVRPVPAPPGPPRNGGPEGAVAVANGEVGGEDSPVEGD